MYNSIPNIDRKHNCIAYYDSIANNISSENTKYIITNPTGLYKVSAINYYIKKQLKENDH